MTLLENYKQRLSISESVYSAKHPGERMPSSKKLITAKLLDNTSKFLNEAFDNSVGTQRSSMGAFKKFALNLVTVAMPSLIGPDLVLTHPMDSMSGYVTYLSFEAGSNKGGIVNGIDENGDRTGDATVFEDPFHIGKPDQSRTNYTSSKVSFGAQPTCDAQGVVYDCLALRWSPVRRGSIEIVVKEFNGSVPEKTYVDYEGKLASIPEGAVKQTIVDDKGNVTTTWVDASGAAVTPTVIDGTEVLYGTTRDDRYNSSRIDSFPVGSTQIKGAGIKGLTNVFVEEATYTLSYSYDNVYIPQNDVPLLNARMKAMPLIAHARRIAVYYSQMSAYQFKAEYGGDLGQELATRASAELAFEIDTEIINGLANAARANSGTFFTWNRALPVGVSMAEHYESFGNTIAQASQVIYDRTQKLKKAI